MQKVLQRYFATGTLLSTRVNLRGQGSTPNVTVMRNRYLNSPLMIDMEYMKAYATAHKKFNGGLHPFLLRAECHGRALESLTPTIREGELVVGSKTRYVRGAIPYCNYAARNYLREFTKEKQDEQDSVAEIGVGGGIKLSTDLAGKGNFVKFGKKFIIDSQGYRDFREVATYFEDKCMQAVSDNMWKRDYAEHEYIENGWRSLLFTAPHEPVPDGRNVLDFETGLRKGFRQIIRETEDRIRQAEISTVANSEKVVFWRACIRVLEATIRWANNYATKAETMASTETNPRRKQELLAIAGRLRHSPENPPRNFAEAVQSWWVMYLCGHIEGSYLGFSPGRFDRYMYPYLKADKNAKPDDVLELMEQLRVKMTELEYVASSSWEGLGSGNLFQNMILGGELRDGTSAENDLSMMVLQAAINCKTVAPTLSIWHSNQLSREFLLKSADVVKTGVGFPAFFNFNVYLQHELSKNGGRFSVGDIREYAAMGGCTEPTLEGMSQGVVQPGFINHGKVFELAMFGGKDPINGIMYTPSKVPETLAELKEAYLLHLGKAIQNFQRYWSYVMLAHKQTTNLFFASALTRDCLGRGLSLDDAGALNNAAPTTLSSGMVNVVNSFASVEYMLKNKLCTMAELRDALQKNWVGYEKLHKAALAAPKWGNDDDMVDKYYVELFANYCDLVQRQTNYLGEKYDPSMLAISTHVPFGKMTGATPDGRFKGEQLADGVTSPMPNTDKNGVFAVLKSSQKIDHTKIRGGLLNIKFHPVTLRGVSGSEKLLSMIKTYFQHNAFQLQFNVVDTKTLRDAQKHPENYRDLIVRVAGFSALFVELGEGIQNELIARTEHFLGGSSDYVDVEEGATSAALVEKGSEALVCNIQDFTVQDGPGIRTTVFLQGCPLRCQWCCNPETQSYKPVYMVDHSLCVGCGTCRKIGSKFVPGSKFPDLSSPKRTPNEKDAEVCPKGAIKVSSKNYSAKQLFDQVKRNSEYYHMSGGGITLSGGEPLHHANFVHEFMTLSRGYGVKLGIETCGQWKMTPTVRDILEGLDFIYYDFKCFTPELHKGATGVDNATILKNMADTAAEHAKKMVISVPIIPGVNTDSQEFTKMMNYVKKVGITKVRLLPFHALGTPKYEKIGRDCRYGKETKVEKEKITELLKIARGLGLACNLE